jgi:hypothetical protein
MSHSSCLNAGDWRLATPYLAITRLALPLCFNTCPMDLQAARHLQALLSALDANMAAPALQPLERLVARPGSGDELILAIVGASGVGKSEIVNAVAGARVATTGPLRPTTTEIAVWGNVDSDYMPGKRISDPEPLHGLAIVDTPAAEHYSEAVANVLDLVDAAIFVTSPERYADAIAATLLSAIRDKGIPVFVVLSVGPRDPSGFEELADDAESKLDTSIDVIVGGDATPLKTLLDAAVLDSDGLRERRERAAATLCAIRTREVAGVLEERVVASQIVIGRADEAFTRARVDRRQLAVMADEDWEVAAPAIADMASDATDRAIGELADVVATDEAFTRAVADASVSLPSIDRGPIDDWHRETADVAVASIKRRRLHPRRSKSVRDEMWRLSIDFDRRPPRRVRKALRDHLPELRFDRGMALTAALGDAGLARIAAFRTDLDPSNRVSPDELRAAADAIAASGSLTGEAADDVA